MAFLATVAVATICGMAAGVLTLMAFEVYEAIVRG